MPPPSSSSPSSPISPSEPSKSHLLQPSASLQHHNTPTTTAATTSLKKKKNFPYTPFQPKWVILLCLGYTIFIQYKAAMHAHEATKKYSYALGIHYDNSDTQWRMFRRSLPLFLAFLVLFVALKWLLLAIWDRFQGHLVSRQSQKWRVRVQCIYYVLANSIFLYILHASDFFVILLPFITLIYIISSIFKKSRLSVFLVWTLCIAALFVCEYRLTRWRGGLSGLYRINVAFNMTFLRLVSFVYDRWEYNTKRRPASLKKEGNRDTAPVDDKFSSHIANAVPSNRSCKCDTCQRNDASMCYSQRAKFGTCSDEEFGYLAFLSYVLYVPLYIAGPITTFNAFASHLKKSQTSFSWKQLGLYLLRPAFGLLCLEIALRYIHSVRILNQPLSVVARLTNLELGSLTFWGIMFVYLKFNFLWKFFRAAALLDGVEVPENLERCALSAYTMTMFWKNWHASYNKWLLRNIYIPLGGNRVGKIRQLLTIFLVFTFVATWHDIQMRLFVWGWLAAFVYIPELLCTHFFKRWNDRWWYDWFVSFGNTPVVIVILMCNVIGFVFGLDETALFFKTFFEQGLTPMFIGFLSIPTTLMCLIELRKYERYYGVRKNAV